MLQSGWRFLEREKCHKENKRKWGVVMNILGVNSVLKWCQVLSNGRKYTCPTKVMDNQLLFCFKKQWHSVAKYATEHTTELVEEGGKIFSRKFR